MATGKRLYEKWFRAGLWLIGMLFSLFLIGLGNLIVGDLPRLEANLSRANYLNASEVKDIESQMAAISQKLSDIGRKAELTGLERDAARNEYQQGYATFKNWISTRTSTGTAEHNAEVVKRTKDLDFLKSHELSLDGQITELQREQLQLQNDREQFQTRMAELNKAADIKLSAETRRQELRIFLYRLILTLPLLLVAGWLIAKQRKSRFWPFVWGFAFFALFAFFVELVPYLPSYGGYVRYIVGIMVTVIVGNYATKAMTRYLQQKQKEEAEPEQNRRRNLAYDLVLTRLGSNVCPGCERRIDLANPNTNNCPHCGLGLFNLCGTCGFRKNAFSPYCTNCGAQQPVTIKVD